MKKIIERSLIIVVSFGLIFTGCEEHPYKVSIDGKVPPTFKINTNGTVYFIRITKSPAPESEIYPNEAGLWQIELIDKTALYQYPEIKYGVVPNSFIQKIPKNDAPPPALIEGQEYLFFAPTPANIKGIRLKFEKGRSVIVE
jgi:hypothetical protein